MHPKTEHILNRTKAFTTDVVLFSRSFPKDPAGFTIARQLIRCAASVGANYREAQWARTKTEFASKLTISLQEAEETRYWLEIIAGTGLAKPETVKPLTTEIAEFIATLVKTIRSAKGLPKTYA